MGGHVRLSLTECCPFLIELAAVHSEPFVTPFDLRFVLFGFPIRVQGLFWLVALLICANGPLQGGTILVLMGGFFVSILVHELGHTFAFRYYGIRSHIVLYWLGGLAIPGSPAFGPQFPWENDYSSRKRGGPWQHVIISFAGPAAGFLLASLIILLIVGTGGKFQLVSSFPVFWTFQLPARQAGNLTLFFLVHYMLYFNIFWGLMNLLPVFPLDGGQIARELFIMSDPWEGANRSMLVSTVVGVAAGIGGFIIGSQYMGFLFLSLAYSSYIAWQQMQGRGGRPW